MAVNKEYWANELVPPYSPSNIDFEVYKNNLIEGTTLLLGCTHKLLNISNNQLDIDPWYEASTVIVGNWIHNNTFYNNIIGDGVLNFTKELTDNILKMCSKNSKKFIARCFNKKLPKMRIANYFPSEIDFLIKPNIIFSFSDYNFFIWDF